MPIGQSVMELLKGNYRVAEDSGKMYGRLLGQCGVIAPGGVVRGPL